MKITKITYWALTGIIAFMMTFSAYFYFTNDMARQGFAHLGFPDYFRVELGIAKLLGAAALLIPLPRRIKEWAYAGFAIDFISAFIAHVASGDPAKSFMMIPVLAAALVGSYITYTKLYVTKN